MSTIKIIHFACVLLSFLLFSMRGVWMIAESPLLKHRFVKVSPHVIDTFLLLSGLGLAIIYYSAFYTQGWLMVKLTAVLGYIFAGSIALKYGRTKVIRVIALVFAWAIFVYIVLVARTRSPIPLLLM